MRLLLMIHSFSVDGLSYICSEQMYGRNYRTNARRNGDRTVTRHVYLLGANVRDEKFVGSRKMADVVVQYPIEALEGPVLHGRTGGG